MGNLTNVAVRNLRIDLGANTIIDDLDLDVRAGEVLGIYGFMGCGVVELSRTLFGKLLADAGSMSIDGKPLRPRSTAEACRAGIAFALR